MQLVKPIETEEERQKIAETLDDKWAIWRTLGVCVVLTFFFYPYTDMAKLAPGLALMSGIVLGTSLAFYQRYIWQRGLTLTKRSEWIPLVILIVFLIGILHPRTREISDVLPAILIGLYSSVLTAPVVRQLWFFVWRKELHEILQDKGLLPVQDAASTRTSSR